MLLLKDDRVAVSVKFSFHFISLERIFQLEKITKGPRNHRSLIGYQSEYPQSNSQIN